MSQETINQETLISLGWDTNDYTNWYAVLFSIEACALERETHIKSEEVS